MTFANVNTYTGGTTVAAGTLQISGSDTLGATTNTTAVSGSGTLDLGATYIARCKPSQNRMLALADVEVSPFAAVGSAEWAKKIALAWAMSLSTRDAAALTKTYAPRVVIGNKELSAADVVSANCAGTPMRVTRTRIAGPSGHARSPSRIAGDLAVRPAAG